jgi:hypothetical protein
MAAAAYNAAEISVNGIPILTGSPLSKPVVSIRPVIAWICPSVQRPANLALWGPVAHMSQTMSVPDAFRLDISAHAAKLAVSDETITTSYPEND